MKWGFLPVLAAQVRGRQNRQCCGYLIPALTGGSAQRRQIPASNGSANSSSGDEKFRLLQPVCGAQYVLRERRRLRSVIFLLITYREID